MPIRQSPSGHSEPFHSGERKHSAYLARLRGQGDSIATKFPSPLKEPLQEDEHPVCWIALPHERFSGMEKDLLYMAQKPINLIIWKIGECCNMSQFS
jgi:hypothetical protein